MSENIPNSKHRYFWRANLAGQAAFIVGTEGNDAVNRDAAWRSVRDYTKSNPRVPIPSLDEIPPEALYLGFVAYPELRTCRKTSNVWPIIANNCIILESLCETPSEVPPVQQAFTLADVFRDRQAS